MKINVSTRSARSITSLIHALRLALVYFLIFMTIKSFAYLTKGCSYAVFSGSKNQSIRWYESFMIDWVHEYEAGMLLRIALISKSGMMNKMHKSFCVDV
jgi:hypothetical protein